MKSEPVILIPADKKKDAQQDFFNVFTHLEKAVYEAVKTYSNVQRGSGHYSRITTALLEEARMIVLDYLKLQREKYMVIFSSPYRAKILKAQLRAHDYTLLSSKEIGLPIGLRALAVKRNALPKGIPSQTGGGMIKLVSPNSLVLADMPERFEAGTPSILHIIALAKALQLMKKYGKDIFKKYTGKTASVSARQILYEDESEEYIGKKLLHALRKSRIDHDILVPTQEGMQPYSNLDNGASKPALLPVWKAVCQTWKQPSSVQQEIIDEVKEICAGFLDAPQTEYEFIFSSNTTEAVNIAAQNMALNFADSSEPVVLNTLLEHHSNELPWRYLHGVSLVRLPADNEGFIDPEKLERLLKEYNEMHLHGKKRIKLVAVSGTSNVLGTFNDIGAIAQIAHRYHARIFVDAAQLVAHQKVSMIKDETDYLVFSGHKLYAPFGSGVLVVRKKLLHVEPGKLTKIRASGEENAAGLAAMGKAIVLLKRIGLEVIKKEEHLLIRQALKGLSCIPGIKIFGIQDHTSEKLEKKAGIIVFRMKHVPHNMVARELAEEGGIGVRTGCFCAHLITKKLMHIHPFRSFLAEVFLKIIPGGNIDLLPGIVRVSFGLENDENDVEHLVQILQKIANKPRFLINRMIASTNNGSPFLAHTAIQKKIDEFTEEVVRKVYSDRSPE